MFLIIIIEHKFKLQSTYFCSFFLIYSTVQKIVSHIMAAFSHTFSRNTYSHLKSYRCLKGMHVKIKYVCPQRLCWRAFQFHWAKFEPKNIMWFCLNSIEKWEEKRKVGRCLLSYIIWQILFVVLLLYYMLFSLILSGLI